MRTVYRTLARQYDPLVLILPYTTRAKVLVQRLGDKHREWDDPLLTEELLQAWKEMGSRTAGIISHYLTSLLRSQDYGPGRCDEGCDWGSSRCPGLH